MKAAFMAGAAALAFALAGCGGGSDSNLSATAAQQAPLPQIAAPNHGDWREVVSMTPDGGYLMGNPNAPVKLVEYASLACPHCREFEETGVPGLRDTYVRSGQVSWEFRNFLLNGPDYALTLLARCQPVESFFHLTEQMYAQQAEFFQNIDDAEGQRIGQLSPEQQPPQWARAMDLDTFFARHGMPGARFDSCLADQAQVARLTQMTNHAQADLGIPGTPTFFINGTMQQNTASWSALEPELRTALGL